MATRSGLLNRLANRRARRPRFALLVWMLFLALMFLPVAPVLSGGLPHHAGAAGANIAAPHQDADDHSHQHDDDSAVSAQQATLLDNCPMCPSHTLCGICGLAVIPAQLTPPGYAGSPLEANGPETLFSQIVNPPYDPPRI
jgi:hypothetical protein